MVVELYEPEDAIADSIEALSATEYMQGAQAEAPWRRSPWPLTAVVDSQLRQHLTFSVSIEDTPVNPDAGSDGADYVTPEVAVVFYFRIRRSAEHALADGRSAQRAAREVAGAIRRAARAGQWGCEPVNAYRPGPIEGGEWLPVEVRFRLGFDLQAAARRT